jgi:lactobin A/cerein 7B family class IIb bacteriocin
VKSFEEVNRSELAQVEGGGALLGAIVVGAIVGGAIVGGVVILDRLGEGDDAPRQWPRNAGVSSGNV